MSRVALIKLQPNQDLYSGLEAACRKAGFRTALILSGVGSLNDAWFRSVGYERESALQCVTGPGLELAGVTGEVSVEENGAGASTLTGWVTRPDGSVSGGVLVRERNIVCITFEFTIMEWTNC
jgi:predicted DNA-binding protein with PD1-like motif